MVIKFSEQDVNDFRIPSFTLSSGEIVIVHIPGGAHFYKTTMDLVDRFTRSIDNGKTVIAKKMKFAEHIKSNGLRYLLFPLTVRKYIKKQANSSNEIYKNIYQIERIKPTTRINELSGTLRKFLSLYVTLSWTNAIILDLVGVDPQGGQDIYKILKDLMRNGGAAILIDNCDEFKNDCTTFLEARYLGTT